MNGEELLKSLGRPAALARREGGVSLRHQLYLTLRAAIVARRIDEGELLPSEDELARAFKVSRVTVRNALELLRKEDFLDTQQGRGTVVRHRHVLEKVHVANVELLDHVRLVGATTTVRLLDASPVKATGELQEFFQCQDKEVLQRIVRLRSGEFGPIFHVVTYLSPLVGRLDRQQLKQQSLLGVLRSKGIHLTCGRQILSATAATAAMASHLNSAPGAPLIYLRRFHRDDAGRAIQYIELHASPDSFEVEMTIGLDPAKAR
jgi:GntR family transcriptional regulator